MFDLTFLAGSQEVLSGPLEEGHWDSREWRERGSSGGGQAGSRARTEVYRGLEVSIRTASPNSPNGMIRGLQPTVLQCWQELKGRSSWTTIPVLWQQVLVASSAVSPARADRWHRQLGGWCGRVRVTVRSPWDLVWMFPKIGVPPPKWMVKIMENPY